MSLTLTVMWHATVKAVMRFSIAFTELVIMMYSAHHAGDIVSALAGFCLAAALILWSWWRNVHRMVTTRGMKI